MSVDTAWTMRQWLEGSRPFFVALSDEDVSRVGALDDTLQLLMEWMITNPCPDKAFDARLKLFAARCGYRALVERPSCHERGPEQHERSGALIDDLVSLLGEVEKLRREIDPR